MSGYLLGVVGTVLLCSFITVIAPEGKTSAVVKGIARLACVLAIIAPVLRFFKGGTLDVFVGGNGENFFTENVIEKEAEVIQYYSEMRIRETEKRLEDELEKKYGVPNEIRFSWTLEEEKFQGIYSAEHIRISQIRVNFSQDVSEETKEEICQYVMENYGSEVWFG